MDPRSLIPLHDLFTLCSTTLLLYLKEGRACLLKAFRKIQQAAVRWPDHTQMQDFAALITGRQPELTGVFSFVDGLNLTIFEPPPGVEQNAFYNGWLS